MPITLSTPLQSAEIKEVLDDNDHCVTTVDLIVQHFDLFLENTVLAAQLRSTDERGADPYRLAGHVNTDFGSHSGEESKLERSLHAQWPAAGVNHFWPTICVGFPAYQLPLFGRQKKNSWGYIDLVGVSPSGNPQVVELKIGSSDDSPFHLIVQGVAYAIALRHAWNRGEFRLHWPVLDGMPSPPTFLHAVDVIALCPSQYWVEAKKWMSSIDGAVQKFHQLLEECRKFHFPVYLGSFDAEPQPESPFFKTSAAVQIKYEAL